MTAHILFGVTSAAGLTLWSTDGNGPGAVSLGVSIAAAFDPVRVGTTTLFIGGIKGVPSLFGTDGTLAGTAPVTLSAGAKLTVTAIAAFGGQAAIATTGAGGAGSLWLSNGTTSRCIETGLLVSGLFAIGGTLYFTGQTMAGGVASRRLYSSDGTVSGTHQITSGSTPLAPDTIAALPGGLVLVRNGVDGSLWAVANGTASRIMPAAAGTSEGTGGLVSFAGVALFSITDSTWGTVSPGAMTLWRSDGTAAGTRQIVTTAAGFESIGPLVAVAVGAGVALFAATDGKGVAGLWSTDGVKATLIGHYAGVQDITAFGSQVAFSALDAAGHLQLWISDGTAAGTHVVLPAGAAASGLAPLGLFDYSGMIGFTGTDSSGHASLWLGDGTTAGTAAVASASGASFQSATEAVAGSGSVVLLDSLHSATYVALDGDTVRGGVDAASVQAPAGNVSVIGGSGALTFTGGSGTSTVIGGSGATTLNGGSGGGMFTAGRAGGSVLAASGGNTTLTGGGALDRLFGAGSGSTTLVAGQGRETLVGGGGSSVFLGGTSAPAMIYAGAGAATVQEQGGGDTIMGGAGTLQVIGSAGHGEAVFAGSGATTISGSLGGADTITGGSGALLVNGRGSNMLVVGGSGSTQVAAGSAAALVYQGRGAMTVGAGSGWLEIVAGAGAATINAGSGGLLIEVTKGSAGGSDVVSGFNPAIDRISLFGYGAADLHLHVASGSSTLSVSDGTTITLLGVANLGSAIERAG